MKSISVFFYFLFSLSAFGMDSSVFSNAMKKSLKKKSFSSSHFGLMISHISSDNKETEFYSLNADHLFIPASLTKIPVLSALYHYYPSYRKFQTKIISSGSITQEVLKGDLVIKGGGDPAFTSESLWNLVNAFTRTGIKVIEGDILVDETLYRADGFLSRTDRSYEAPVSAASFNWNSVTFRIRPGEKAGSKAQIFVDPQNSYIQIRNRVTTSEKSKTKIRVSRVSQSGKSETFQFTGVISHSTEEVSKFRNIKNPSLWLGYNVVSFLKQRGIQVKGGVKKGRCSSGCLELAKWDSHPFSRLAYYLMKYSNNFIARMLVTHLSMEKGLEQGDFKTGMEWIEKYLTDEVKLKKYSLKEPSGLSRKNKFSPRDLQKILILDSKKQHNPEVLFSYPLAGGVGTLEKRYSKKQKEFHIRAKTGSLSGVAGLAGWASRKEGESYIFTFLYNGPARKTLQAQNMFDEMILFLLKN
ncbi:MAG: D-alanyl-D-alanine carboxypeptidase/D-alanyl-D-alanine-endopeptidase [Bdellovibrionales bacterium]|nr:D-alanyl-D-alanine carboxypeptidase/D-alanyl-D-alanine-endopeptidase [Bdellovibrionales bacterium]